jgi:3-oxoacyl-[acyl-carrier-protein] synthase-3
MQAGDPNAFVSGTHFVVPDTVQSAADIAELVGRKTEWIVRNVGVSSRHICERGTDPVELAAFAALPLLDKQQAPDMLIYASASVRQCIPDTSVFLAKRLGLSGIPCHSVNATCLSFLVAMQNAAALIRCGVHQRVLIVTAEIPSLSRNMSHPESAALFGDAAAAVMMDATNEHRGVLCSKMKTWPKFSELAQVRGGGLLRHPRFPDTADEDYFFEMDGDSLLRKVMPRLRRFVEEFLSESGLRAEDVDLVIPHQASAAGMKLVRSLGFRKDSVVDILENYGNCVSASLPMALAIANQENRLARGDHVLMLGSAAGLSLGAILFKW